MVVMLELLMSGFITIILLMRLVHRIRLLDMIMGLDVRPRLNVRTVCREGDVGLRRMLRFMELRNMARSRGSKT